MSSLLHTSLGDVAVSHRRARGTNGVRSMAILSTYATGLKRSCGSCYITFCYSTDRSMIVPAVNQYLDFIYGAIKRTYVFHFQTGDRRRPDTRFARRQGETFG